MGHVAGRNSAMPIFYVLVIFILTSSLTSMLTSACWPPFSFVNSRPGGLFQMLPANGGGGSFCLSQLFAKLLNRFSARKRHLIGHDRKIPNTSQNCVALSLMTSQVGSKVRFSMIGYGRVRRAKQEYQIETLPVK